jgi:hypothetical protein
MVQVLMVELYENLDTLIPMDSLNPNFDYWSE